ncbi:MAG: nickel pincer cofactor biosynthesis protein LarC [Calditrichia bacterium]
MKYLYIDAIGGASGDMLLGAFLDGLVPFDYLQSALAKLQLPDYQLELNETHRHHIAACKFSVTSTDKTHRTLTDIAELIQASSLPQEVRSSSAKVFQKLARHEARIHQMPVEKVHFHEVGAVDSIIDIVGTFVCIDYLKPDIIYSSPLPVSRGFVKAAHGTLPMPAPATLSLLKNYPLIYRHMEAELVTPTGAVLIESISKGLFPEHQPFNISEIGYGAGSRNFSGIPNLLRIWLGDFPDGVWQDSVLQIETNIDDMNPELYPFLQQQLLEAGAMDVTFYQGIMKKGRPGTLISILADAAILKTIRSILYRQTSTIGFRYFPVYREKLPRELRIVDSPWGKVQIKVVVWEGIERRIPEFEECRRIAAETGRSLIEVYNEIQSFLLKAPAAPKQ